MLTLLLILLLTGITLGVVLYVGGFFLQAYIYTEPSNGLIWQAPATAALLTLLLAFWCWRVASHPDAHPLDIPYDTVFRFSARVDMYKQPVKELWAIKKNGEKVPYLRKRLVEPPYYLYVDKNGNSWRQSGVTKIMIVVDGGEKLIFDVVEASAGGYRQFVHPDGWTMVEYDKGPTGLPTSFRFGRFLMNVVLNTMHFMLWFLGLWLLMRFQWAHALGLAAAAWATFTLVLLPMLLSYAAEVAKSSSR
ncbi:MAG: hypothetical protein L0Y72_07765 [Gemmataceae bacterium]|nr:hypothetical protein [Gemmataceae bacterium]